MLGLPRAHTICSVSGCLEVAAREGKCEKHKRPSWERTSKRNIDRPGSWQTIRDRVRRRDQYRCRWCGVSGAKIVDHIKPVSQGGSWELDNLAVMCESCHREKSYRERFRR